MFVCPRDCRSVCLSASVCMFVCVRVGVCAPRTCARKRQRIARCRSPQTHKHARALSSPSPSLSVAHLCSLPSVNIESWCSGMLFRSICLGCIGCIHQLLAHFVSRANGKHIGYIRLTYTECPHCFALWRWRLARGHTLAVACLRTVATAAVYSFLHSTPHRPQPPRCTLVPCQPVDRDSSSTVPTRRCLARYTWHRTNLNHVDVSTSTICILWMLFVPVHQDPCISVFG